MAESSGLKRLNIGCGDVPTIGWVNYDNSLALRLARVPIIPILMGKLGLISPRQRRFIKLVRQVGIKYADAVNHIPEAENSVEVLYTCHMLEHLDRNEAEKFLKEVRRVLVPNGILRIVLPDLRFYLENYLKDTDADAFVESLYMSLPRTSGLVEKLKFLLVGERHHLWMYDGQSLCRLLERAGFQCPKVLEPGQTAIRNPGELDLFERASESVFVEATNP